MKKVAFYVDGEYFFFLSQSYAKNSDSRPNYEQLSNFAKVSAASYLGITCDMAAICTSRYLMSTTKAHQTTSSKIRSIISNSGFDVTEVNRSANVPLVLSNQIMKDVVLHKPDVVVLVAANNDYRNTVQTLASLGVATILLSWDSEHEDSVTGVVVAAVVGKALYDSATYLCDMAKLISGDTDELALHGPLVRNFDFSKLLFQRNSDTEFNDDVEADDLVTSFGEISNVRENDLGTYGFIKLSNGESVHFLMSAFGELDEPVNPQDLAVYTPVVVQYKNVLRAGRNAYPAVWMSLDTKATPPTKSVESSLAY
jgi:hypothetical protein